MNLDRKFFFDLERRLIDAGLDSDSESFAAIKKRLSSREPLPADEFARQAVYVVLAGGFSQKTAKKIHEKIMLALQSGKSGRDDLFALFRNKNKINAAIEIWRNRAAYRDGYYHIADSRGQTENADLLNEKLSYLQKLPHIGKITANHLARNLGEDIVKYDIWIQRLGAAFAAPGNLSEKINNGRLDPDVKAACDKMFAHLVRETGLPRGYIDVVLWKGLQNHMIKGV